MTSDLLTLDNPLLWRPTMDAKLSELPPRAINCTKHLGRDPQRPERRFSTPTTLQGAKIPSLTGPNPFWRRVGALSHTNQPLSVPVGQVRHG